MNNTATIRRPILASHLIWTGYGHWLSNDLRGSGSIEIRKEELKQLGPIHHGRKLIQPPRDEVRQFYNQADPLLDHARLWFEDPMRRALAQAMGEAALKLGYTVYAFAVCTNHVHAVVRAHRDRAVVIWQKLANAALLALRGGNLIPQEHPLWSDRPYKVFLYNNPVIAGRIQYVWENPIKAGLPPQPWPFIVPFRPINAAKGKQVNTLPYTKGTPPARPSRNISKDTRNA